MYFTYACILNYAMRKPGCARGEPMIIRRLLSHLPTSAGQEASMCGIEHTATALEGHCTAIAG